jgi:hypothetical protein
MKRMTNARTTRITYLVATSVLLTIMRIVSGSGCQDVQRSRYLQQQHTKDTGMRKMRKKEAAKFGVAAYMTCS